MKRINIPEQKEEATYYSDFSGKCFGEAYPPVEVKLEFNYGSKYDGAELELHLSDEEAKSILDFIKSKISDNYKKDLEKQLKNCERQYDDSMQFRDWDSCKYSEYNVSLLEYILDKNHE